MSMTTTMTMGGKEGELKNASEEKKKMIACLIYVMATASVEHSFSRPYFLSPFFMQPSSNPTRRTRLFLLRVHIECLRVCVCVCVQKTEYLFSTTLNFYSSYFPSTDLLADIK
jgi:hypothetical protein